MKPKLAVTIKKETHHPSGESKSFCLSRYDFLTLSNLQNFREFEIANAHAFEVSVSSRKKFEGKMADLPRLIALKTKRPVPT